MITMTYSKPVVVLSRSLTQRELRTDLAGKVRLGPQLPKEIMETLAKEGWRRANVEGGHVVQSFLCEGLIADMVSWEAAFPLFGLLEKDVALEHIATTAFPSGFAR